MKKVIAGIVIGIFIAAMGWAHRDQIEVRYNCAGKIAQQYTTTQVVPGAWNCINPNVKYALSVLYNIKTASAFAAGVGSSQVTATYLGETSDGGYTYRFDVAVLQHNSIKAAANDVWSWPWVWKWNGNDWHKNLNQVWSELNGDTQGNVSIINTYFLYPPGTYLVSWADNKTYDVSGEIETIS